MPKIKNRRKILDHHPLNLSRPRYSNFGSGVIHWHLAPKLEKKIFFESHFEAILSISFRLVGVLTRFLMTKTLVELFSCVNSKRHIWRRATMADTPKMEYLAGTRAFSQRFRRKVF